MTRRRKGIAGWNDRMSTDMETGSVKVGRPKQVAGNKLACGGEKDDQGKVLGSQRGQSLLCNPVA